MEHFYSEELLKISKLLKTDPIYLSPKPPSKILKNLYLGSMYNSADIKTLKSLKIRYILNITPDVKITHPSEFEYLRISVLDKKNEDLKIHFEKGVHFIKEGLEKGFGVFVHCRAGVSRSPVFVCAFLMKERGFCFEEALEIVKGKRNVVFPKVCFLEQLEKYGEGFKKVYDFEIYFFYLFIYYYF